MYLLRSWINYILFQYAFEICRSKVMSVNGSSNPLMFANSGVVAVKRLDVGWNAFVTVRNTGPSPLHLVGRMLECCEAIGTDENDCTSMRLMGGSMGVLQPSLYKNVTFLYANMYPYNRRGECSVEIWYKDKANRTDSIKVVIPFDTYIRSDFVHPSMEVFGEVDKLQRVCESPDMDPLDNCRPVDCHKKYNGNKNFYSTVRKECLPNPTCYSDPDKELPDVAYVPTCNECRDVETPINEEDLRSLLKPPAQCTHGENFPSLSLELKEYTNVRCHHGTFDNDSALCVCSPGWISAPIPEDIYIPSTLLLHFCTIRKPTARIFNPQPLIEAINAIWSNNAMVLLSMAGLISLILLLFVCCCVSGHDSSSSNCSDGEGSDDDKLLKDGGADTTNGGLKSYFAQTDFFSDASDINNVEDLLKNAKATLDYSQDVLQNRLNSGTLIEQEQMINKTSVVEGLKLHKPNSNIVNTVFENKIKNTNIKRRLKLTRELNNRKNLFEESMIFVSAVFVQQSRVHKRGKNKESIKHYFKDILKVMIKEHGKVPPLNVVKYLATKRQHSVPKKESCSGSEMYYIPEAYKIPVRLGENITPPRKNIIISKRNSINHTRASYTELRMENECQPKNSSISYTGKLQSKFIHAKNGVKTINTLDTNTSIVTQINHAKNSDDSQLMSVFPNKLSNEQKEATMNSTITYKSNDKLPLNEVFNVSGGQNSELNQCSSVVLNLEYYEIQSDTQNHGTTCIQDNGDKLGFYSYPCTEKMCTDIQLSNKLVREGNSKFTTNNLKNVGLMNFAQDLSKNISFPEDTRNTGTSGVIDSGVFKKHSNNSEHGFDLEKTIFLKPVQFSELQVNPDNKEIIGCITSNIAHLNGSIRQKAGGGTKYEILPKHSYDYFYEPKIKRYWSILPQFASFEHHFRWNDLLITTSFNGLLVDPLSSIHSTLYHLIEETMFPNTKLVDRTCNDYFEERYSRGLPLNGLSSAFNYLRVVNLIENFEINQSNRFYTTNSRDWKNYLSVNLSFININTKSRYLPISTLHVRRIETSTIIEEYCRPNIFKPIFTLKNNYKLDTTMNFRNIDWKYTNRPICFAVNDYNIQRIGIPYRSSSSKVSQIPIMKTSHRRKSLLNLALTSRIEIKLLTSYKSPYSCTTCENNLLSRSDSELSSATENSSFTDFSFSKIECPLVSFSSNEVLKCGDLIEQSDIKLPKGEKLTKPSRSDIKYYLNSMVVDTNVARFNRKRGCSNIPIYKKWAKLPQMFGFDLIPKLTDIGYREIRSPPEKVTTPFYNIANKTQCYRSSE